MQIELDAEPFAHRGKGDDVDIVVGGNAVELMQRRTRGVGTRPIRRRGSSR